MSLLQLLILAIAAMIGLAALRLTRVHFGRTPLPDGRGRLPFFLAFVAVPPIALAFLLDPTATEGPLRGGPSVLPYVAILAGVWIVIWAAALIVSLVVPGRWRPLVLLALVGREADLDDLPFDPPVTAALAESIALVDRANTVFPRGPEFPTQIERSGFRASWDSLDAATTTLEGRIADDRRLGLGVASDAMATAKDARSRLDTLRRLAIDHGQAWAAV
jgi:hypothetical protein